MSRDYETSGDISNDYLDSILGVLQNILTEIKELKNQEMPR